MRAPIPESHPDSCPTVERPVGRLELLQHRRVTVGNKVKFVRLQPEEGPAALFQDGEGAQKAEGEFDTDLAEAGIRTIAVWQPFRRQLLADVPQLMAAISEVLSIRVREQAERSMVADDGTSGAMLGLVPTATHFVPTVTTGMADAVAEAAAYLRTLGWNRGIAVLNPMDWFRITVARGDDGHYHVANWATPTGLVLWGLSVVQSNSVAPGHAIFMDRAAALILDREE